MDSGHEEKWKEVCFNFPFHKMKTSTYLIKGLSENPVTQLVAGNEPSINVSY